MQFPSWLVNVMLSLLPMLSSIDFFPVWLVGRRELAHYVVPTLVPTRRLHSGHGCRLFKLPSRSIFGVLFSSARRQPIRRRALCRLWVLEACWSSCHDRRRPGGVPLLPPHPTCPMLSCLFPTIRHYLIPITNHTTTTTTATTTTSQPPILLLPLPSLLLSSSLHLHFHTSLPLHPSIHTITSHSHSHSQ